MGGGSGGCEPRIEDIIKLKKSGSGWLGPVGDQVGVSVGRGSTNVNHVLKVLLKEHKGVLQLVTVNKRKTGAHNPLGLLKMRGN